jgi:hypothetical protein
MTRQENLLAAAGFSGAISVTRSVFMSRNTVTTEELDRKLKPITDTLARHENLLASISSPISRIPTTLFRPSRPRRDDRLFRRPHQLLSVSSRKRRIEAKGNDIPPYVVHTIDLHMEPDGVKEYVEGDPSSRCKKASANVFTDIMSSQSPFPRSSSSVCNNGHSRRVRRKKASRIPKISNAFWR